MTPLDPDAIIELVNAAAFKSGLTAVAPDDERATSSDDRVWLVCDADGNRVAMLFRRVGGQLDARARLFAESPRLLLALATEVKRLRGNVSDVTLTVDFCPEAPHG